ncbi:dde superfamily endonuclease [Holotrichia oblita]|uniref:Dde superfamily endonuclease n=1 Tax=Holotrichia oblita TaxID=644536 RepID=A0ACB9TUJ6_HOLOL|nr:dde superfamily endonuclease [Holotrichia oblita]
MQMEQEYEKCILLGDSAYPCRNYLMTPVAHPRYVAENNYNNAQRLTRNCIEICFGVLKRRFPALALGMRIAKETALTAIVAASVLHNIAIAENNILPAPEVEIPEVLHNAPLGDAADSMQPGVK